MTFIGLCTSSLWSWLTSSLARTSLEKWHCYEMQIIQHAIMMQGGTLASKSSTSSLILLQINVTQQSSLKTTWQIRKNLQETMSFILFKNVTCSIFVFYTPKKKNHKSSFIILKWKVNRPPPQPHPLIAAFSMTVAQAQAVTFSSAAQV